MLLFVLLKSSQVSVSILILFLNLKTNLNAKLMISRKNWYIYTSMSCSVKIFVLND